MSGTVNYSDEDKLLTSDEFIAAAKQNADKNLQIQKDTAQKVYDSTYASLDRQYNEAAAAAGVAKERNLIDADTAYQRQEMKYGAEQEALAAAGLSGSGMNEYRRAQSYQKNREDRQMSYAEYDRALREAAYTRDQGKLTADINKMQADADADILYNDTMTGIAEKELGYADLERQEIDAAYSGYLAGIEDGSLTLDQIMADSSWEKLSDGQKKAVITASTVKGLKGRIDNGESWDEITTSDAYKGLNDDGKNQVAGYHAQVVASKTKDAEAAVGSYLEMANAGWSIDDILAAAKGNGHYDILEKSGSWQSVVNAVSSYADDKANKERGERMSEYVDLAAKGTSLEDIKAMMAINGDTYVEEGSFTELSEEEYNALSEEEKAKYDEEKAAYDEARNFMKLIESAAQKYSDDQTTQKQEQLLTYLDLAASGKYTLDQLKAIAQSLGHYDALSEIVDNKETGLWAQVVSAFEKTESENTNNETLTNIDNAIANGATLEEIQNMPGYENLDPEVQEQIGEQIEARDDEEEVAIDSFVANLFMPGEEVYSLDDLDTRMRAEGVPESMRTEIVSKYQGEMASRTIASINDGSAFDGEYPLTGAILVENIKNGLYGEKGREVAKSYFEKRVGKLTGDDIVAIVKFASDLDELSEYLTPAEVEYFDSKLSTALKTIPSSKYTLAAPKNALDQSDNNKTELTVDGVPYTVSGKITDTSMLAALSIATDESDKQVLKVGKTVYLRRGDHWYECPEDYTKPVTLTDRILASANIKTGSVTVKTQYFTGIVTREINGKRITSAGAVDNKTSIALNKKYSDMKTGSYVIVNNRIYVKEASGSWTFSYFE